MKEKEEKKIELVFDDEKFVLACCGELEKMEMDKVLAALLEMPKKDLESQVQKAYIKRCKKQKKKKMRLFL